MCIYKHTHTLKVSYTPPPLHIFRSSNPCPVIPISVTCLTARVFPAFGWSPCTPLESLNRVTSFLQCGT